MDLITSIKIFKQIVIQSSFTKAAEQLNISTAMASKHVAFLENHLQARLLTRTSRRISVTEVGEQFFTDASEALELLEQATDRASSVLLKPKGQLKISVPGWLAIPCFAEWITEYHQLYPEVQVILALENRRVDLLAEGYDLVLRVTDDPLPSLIVKPITPVDFLLVGSQQYFLQKGQPKTLEDLAKHQCILPTHASLEQIFKADAATYAYELPAIVYTNDTLMEYHLAKAGLGLSYLPKPIIYNDLQAGELIQVLPEYQHPPLTLYAAYINREYLSAKVRTFIDFLVPKIRATQALWYDEK